MEWPGNGVDVGWVDLAMLAVLVLSAFVGAVRGLVFELVSLAGWIAAWIGGFWLGPAIAPHLPLGPAGSWPNAIGGFALAFLLVLVVCKLAARALSTLVKATPLRPVDRLLGAAFGLLRGVLVLLLVAIVIGWAPPVAASPWWRESRGAALLGQLLDEIAPLVRPRAPADATRRDA